MKKRVQKQELVIMLESQAAFKPLTSHIVSSKIMLNFKTNLNIKSLFAGSQDVGEEEDERFSCKERGAIR